VPTTDIAIKSYKEKTAQRRLFDLTLMLTFQRLMCTGYRELTRLSTGTGAEFSAMSDVPQHKFVDNLRPPCSRCGRPLILTRIEPEEPGFDLRTYFCAACNASETVVAAIGSAVVARKLGPEI
jgi:hypothetical protein